MSGKSGAFQDIIDFRFSNNTIILRIKLIGYLVKVWYIYENTNNGSDRRYEEMIKLFTVVNLDLVTLTNFTVYRTPSYCILYFYQVTFFYIDTIVLLQVSGT